MISVTIRTRNNGPFVVEGPVTIVDAQGNPFSITIDKPAIALCRCGHSSNKPFCDGSHNRCGFAAAELATGPEQDKAE
jgi:CDGSH-type Zn-finger protein